MPAKVRVYELAREMGLSNKEILDLCTDLGIGVKSHSSSVVEAQAATEKAKVVAAGYLEELGVVSRLPEGITRLLAAKVAKSYPALEED